MLLERDNIIINCVIYSTPCPFLLHFLYHFRHDGYSDMVHMARIIERELTDAIKLIGIAPVRYERWLLDIFR